MSDPRKKSELLEAGERSEFLGYEGPFLSDGRKTKPGKKGRANSSLGTQLDRGIFSPGPSVNTGQKPEDKIDMMNPAATLSGGVPSISRMATSAGRENLLVGTETIEKSGLTAEPSNKRPFPPVNRQKNELAMAASMDFEESSHGTEQIVLKEAGKIMMEPGIAGGLDIAAELVEELDMVISGSAGPIDGKRRELLSRDSETKKSVQDNHSGEKIGDTNDLPIPGRPQLLEMALGENGTECDLTGRMSWTSEDGTSIGGATGNSGGDGLPQLPERALGVIVAEGGLAGRSTRTEEDISNSGKERLPQSSDEDWMMRSERKLEECERATIAIKEPEAGLGWDSTPRVSMSDGAGVGGESSGSLSMGLESARGATDILVGAGANYGLCPRVVGGDLDVGRAMEDQDPIKGRLWLEALGQKRYRWSLARTLLFGMEVTDLEWVAGAGFLEDIDPGAAIRGGEILVGLSSTERMILQEMAQAMLEIMKTGGPLQEIRGGEARELQGKLGTLSVIQRLGSTGGIVTDSEEGGLLVERRTMDVTGDKKIDSNMGSINGRIEVLPEGIVAPTLGTESDLREGSNPVPRGLRVVRLDVKDTGCPGISPDVRLGARTGGSPPGGAQNGGKP